MVLAVPVVEPTLGTAALEETAEAAEMEPVSEILVRQEIPVLQEILAETETTQTDLAVLAVRQALAAAQPANTSVVCLMSHLQTMELCKEAQRNGIHDTRN